MAKEGVENVMAAKWKKCVDHVIQKVENHYRTSDGVVEQEVERLVGAEDSSDSEKILLGEYENDNNDKYNLSSACHLLVVFFVGNAWEESLSGSML